VGDLCLWATRKGGQNYVHVGIAGYQGTIPRALDDSRRLQLNL
jgi:hypothetical protein